MINFVFMLTKDDATVPDALEVLDGLRGSSLRYVGFKDVGATVERLTAVAAKAHDLEMEVMLEVVSTSVEDERRSLEAAAEIGVDWVLGGTHPEIGTAVLAGRTVHYCPFPGTVVGHPSVLEGETSEIAEDARRLTATAGIDGVDLLAYRHPEADVERLVAAVVAAADGPVIAAGSVAGFGQIEALERAGAWGFTIGSAIFEGKLPGGPGVPGQVAAVLAAAQGETVASA
ncbi:MAG: 1-(5-phosphoribosyl)-5-((5-phosphoribosylamino)methylideneamino)imidazole-4-carboxamide isomerase [Actinobacteria bacterium]|nr:1-(5-phosphoribosyl)-5-((5-phosphoribosylamino)methylideneamino)imidazole-4-carboxamide isomerase [Actinomycetota bacterium]